MRTSQNRHKINSEHTIYNYNFQEAYRRIHDDCIIYRSVIWSFEQQKNIYITIDNFPRYKMFTESGEKEKNNQF